MEPFADWNQPDSAIPPPGYILRAHYRCARCKREWTHRAGPTQCPKCNALYVTWINHPLTAIYAADMERRDEGTGPAGERSS